MRSMNKFSIRLRAFRDFFGTHGRPGRHSGHGDHSGELPGLLSSLKTLLATLQANLSVQDDFPAFLQAKLTVQDDFPASLQADLSVQDNFSAFLKADLSVHDDILDLFEIVDATCMRDAHTSCRHNSVTVLWRVHTSIYIYIYI